jgi:hypothetical protein
VFAVPRTKGPPMTHRIFRRGVSRQRKLDNAFRPHSSLGYRLPAPEAVEVGPPVSRISTPDSERALA